MYAYMCMCIYIYIYNFQLHAQAARDPEPGLADPRALRHHAPAGRGRHVQEILLLLLLLLMKIMI